MSQANNLTIAENNGYVQKFWETDYKAIENCNSTIEGIEAIADGVLTEDRKTNCWVKPILCALTTILIWYNSTVPFL